MKRLQELINNLLNLQTSTGEGVLGRESNHWLLEIKESLFIKRDRLSLNKNIYSQELFLILVLRCPLQDFDSFFLLLLDILFVNLVDC